METKSDMPMQLQRPATLGEVAELMALGLGLMAILSNVPHQVVSSALTEIAKAGTPEQAVAVRYMASRIAEAGSTFDGPASQGTH